MLRRLLPALVVAAALVAAAYTHSGDPVIETEALSHGPAECDSNGVSVGYEVAFVEDRSPRGYRVQTVTVEDIATECGGHEIAVGLYSGADPVARTNGTPVSGSTMTMPLRENPLAAVVDGVAVKIDEDILPPAPGVTPTPTRPVIPTPAPSQTGAPDTGRDHPKPRPIPGTRALRPDPAGSPLPATQCDPAVKLCGTTGNDHASISDGALDLGPGIDSIDISTGPATTEVDVDAGPGKDSLSLTVAAPAGSAQSIVIDAGAGADYITLAFGEVQLGATVKITIVASDGDDVISIPSSLPPGVTVRIVAGSGNDVVVARSQQSDSTPPVMLMWISGGYRIEGNRGSDSLSGGLGPDVITSGRGSDAVAGGKGADVLRGGRHGDVLRGSEGNDRIRGGRGHDVLYGGPGADRLGGGAAPDTCRGGAGRDSFRSCGVAAQ
jgi:hypothetical protein